MSVPWAVDREQWIARQPMPRRGWPSTIHYPLLLLLTLANSANAVEQPPVLVEPAATSPNVRLGKPMPTLWDVSKRPPGLLEGKLEFRVHLEAEEFYTYTTDDLVLHAPDQRLRFLFPAVTDAVSTPELEVDITWIGKTGGRVPLKRQLLRIPFTAQKTLLMAVGEGRSGHGRTAVWEARLDSLRPESLASAAIRQQLQHRDNFLPLQTVSHSWDANLFPQEPLAYTPYDAVAITGEIFSGLRRQQLEAIETWVRAGGRLYLEPDGLLESSHTDFLNRLTANDQPPVRWSLDRVGKLDWPVLNDADEYQAAVDLGRVVIRHPEAASPTIGEASLRFLWDIPPGIDPVQQIMMVPRSMGQVMRGIGRRGSGLVGNFYENPQPRLFDELQRTLMPSGVQIVPVWLIAMLLGGLVLAIGPGEWWLLGKLRLRRFTWLTWPAATIAVTAITVGLSNWYMSSAETSRFLNLVDLGTDGRVVRSQRFELTFPSRARAVTADVQRGLWRVVNAPMDSLTLTPVLIGQPPPRGPGQPMTPGASSDVLKHLAPPTYDGRVPNRFTVTQTVPQWTPRLSHRYELPGDDRDSPIDWTTIDTQWTDSIPQAATKITDTIVKQRPEAAVFVIDRSGVIVSQVLSTVPWSLASLLRPMTKSDPEQMTDPWTRTSDRFGWSDLPILSPTGPYDFAVLIVVPDGSGWTVYRRPVRMSQLAAKTEL